jgi:malonyl CoA-acyl carrier protein transacylase
MCQVAELCEAASKEVPEGQGVRIANYLCNGNYAVSGGIAGCEALEGMAKSFKARSAHTHAPHTAPRAQHRRSPARAGPCLAELQGGVWTGLDLAELLSGKVPPDFLHMPHLLHLLHLPPPAAPLRMTVRLAVAGAFHTDFMAPAREKLQEALAGTTIRVSLCWHRSGTGRKGACVCMYCVLPSPHSSWLAPPSQVAKSAVRWLSAMLDPSLCLSYLTALPILSCGRKHA